jgi:hypothetical protein
MGAVSPESFFGHCACFVYKYGQGLLISECPAPLVVSGDQMTKYFSGDWKRFCCPSQRLLGQGPALGFPFPVPAALSGGPGVLIQ